MTKSQTLRKFWHLELFGGTVVSLVIRKFCKKKNTLWWIDWFSKHCHGYYDEYVDLCPIYQNSGWVAVGGSLMHHLHPTRHANTAPIHPRDGGRLRRWSKWLRPAPRDQTLSSLTTRFLSPPSIQITSRRKSGRMAAQIRVQSTYF